jgi:O-antigen/teichoic acid export membrane protein
MKVVSVVCWVLAVLALGFALGASIGPEGDPPDAGPILAALVAAGAFAVLAVVAWRRSRNTWWEAVAMRIVAGLCALYAVGFVVMAAAGALIVVEGQPPDSDSAIAPLVFAGVFAAVAVAAWRSAKPR